MVAKYLFCVATCIGKEFGSIVVCKVVIIFHISKAYTRYRWSLFYLKRSYKIKTTPQLLILNKSSKGNDNIYHLGSAYDGSTVFRCLLRVVRWKNLHFKILLKGGC